MDSQNIGNWAFLKQIEDSLFGLYKQVPWHLPAGLKEFIVKVGPVITLIVMVLAIPFILIGLGLSALFAPFAPMYGPFGHMNTGWMLPGLISLVAFVIDAMALPGLFARTLNGWNLLFLAALVNAVAQILSYNIIGAIIGLALAVYILFEIKSYYH
ncbi:MAG TPA: hypothetical protein VE973_00490 [Candidatus Limnocylindria bacterium]|nr:hypothetical protein [Candidatus Limnocylindria bacterium]